MKTWLLVTIIVASVLVVLGGVMYYAKNYGGSSYSVESAVMPVTVGPEALAGGYWM